MKPGQIADMPTFSRSGGRRSTGRPAHYSRAALRIVLAVALLMTAAAARAQEASFAQHVEARVLALVNGLRAEHGLGPLEREARLDEAAGYLANYMAQSGRFDHRADGTSPGARVKQRGYAYCNLSENIAMEYSSRGFSPEALAHNLVEGWRASASHRENLLDPAPTQTGLAIGRNARGEHYAAQLFARPRATPRGCR